MCLRRFEQRGWKGGPPGKVQLISEGKFQKRLDPNVWKDCHAPEKQKGTGDRTVKAQRAQYDPRVGKNSVSRSREKGNQRNMGERAGNHCGPHVDSKAGKDVTGDQQKKRTDQKKKSKRTPRGPLSILLEKEESRTGAEKITKQAPALSKKHA